MGTARAARRNLAIAVRGPCDCPKTYDLRTIFLPICLFKILRFLHNQRMASARCYCGDRALPIMSRSYLVCDESMEPLSCPYPLYNAAFVQRQAAAVQFSYGFIRAPWPLRYCLARSYDKSE